MSAGTRARAAITWEPTASTNVRPTPKRIWLVVTVCPSAHLRVVESTQ